MNTIKVYGASDDLVEFEGVISAKDSENPDDNPMAPKNEAEFNVYHDHVYFRLGSKIIITANYMPNGTWSFGVGMVSEDIPFPDYKISIEASEDVPYSTQLIIEGVPEDEAVIIRLSEDDAQHGQFD